mgnify:CR=1 FL=1
MPVNAKPESMKAIVIALFFLSNSCFGQYWMLEVQAGGAAYNGDLTQSRFSFNRLGPSVNLNFKYNTNDFLILRAGAGWGTLMASDKDNKHGSLNTRNLDFKTNLLEFTVCAEMNLCDPEIFTSYPYMMLGLGLFHFDPFTYDKNGNKTYLKPLSTEGQGLPEYPDRKEYALTQFCIPFGAGWKWRLKKDWELSVEFAYRVTFTDYLDDVSKTYVDPEILSSHKGQLAAELSYRKENKPFNELGENRGNDDVKDLYYFTGLKLSVPLRNKKKEADRKKTPVPITPQTSG